jgi:hypothetical protein
MGKGSKNTKAPTRQVPRRGSAKSSSSATATAVAEGGPSVDQVQIVEAEAIPRRTSTPPSAKKARLAGKPAGKPAFEDVINNTAMATVLQHGMLKNHIKETSNPFLAYIGKNDEASYWVLHAIVRVLKCEDPLDLDEFLASTCPLCKKATRDTWRQHINTAAANNQAKVSLLIKTVFEQLTLRANNEHHVLELPDNHNEEQWNNWIAKLYSPPPALSANLYYDDDGKLRAQDDAINFFGHAYDEREKLDKLILVLSGDHPTLNLITLMKTEEEAVLAVFSTFLVCCIYKNDISHYLALFAAGRKDFRKLPHACLFSCT